MQQYLKLINQRNTGVGGGSCSALTRNNAPFNVVVENTIINSSWSVSGSTLEVPGGTYEYRFSHTQSGDCLGSNFIIHDLMSSIDIEIGESCWDSAAGSDYKVISSGRFTLADYSQLKLFIWTRNSSPIGFGIPMNVPGKPEIYGTFELRKLDS